MQQEVLILLTTILIHSATRMPRPLISQIECVMLGVVCKFAARDAQVAMTSGGAPLTAVRYEHRDRDTDRYAGATMVAIWPVRESTASPEAQPNELAVDACVDQMAWSRDLR